MSTPSAESFGRLFAQQEGRRAVIPVYREVLADLDTPVSAFLKVCEGEGSSSDHAFLLESVEGGERWARYSFIGLEPALVVSAKGSTCRIQTTSGSTEHTCTDPLALLAETLGSWHSVKLPGLPPFAGGAVGWLAWDALRWWEKLPSPHPVDSEEAPTLVFSVPRSLLIFDNLRHRISVVHLVFTDEHEDADSAHKAACARIDTLIDRLRSPLPKRSADPPGAELRQSSFSQPDFQAAVERVREYIHQGDCIQVVLSQCFDLDFHGAPLDLYRALRALNPSPYMFYLRYPEQRVIGASPEVMVRVADGQAFVSPIAGTRRRGENEAEDEALEQELLNDPKERAEHVMLVDLARNDLGRVAEAGSVEVDTLMGVQRFSHVMHIVSDVSAKLAADKTGADAVRATFPAGTLSGAPKVRAMEIIDELEPVGRGLYGGAVGWMGFDGNLDLAIAIRTTWGQGTSWKLQVGAGIVADSDPEAEYQETLSKAGAVLQALEIAGRGL